MHKTFLKRFLQDRLNVLHEKEDEQEIVDIISAGVVFKGANLWVLIFAVFIASLGLNTNSTAVIIGAMLISPLMGPIMGFGMGLGINDFDLIKRSFRNFTVATLFSVLTSTFYFLISPLSEAQSELLARTQPTIYDVMIAFFGGMAGMLAVSIKQKGNVIPGVAIATALMPPLCTAGFGLATGNWSYFFGAFYLYFINTVFISFATLLVVRFLRYKAINHINPIKNRKVTRYIGLIVLCTLLPSLYLSYRMIMRNYQQTRVNNFVNNELQFPNSQIISKKMIEVGDSLELSVILLGQAIPEIMIENAEKRLSKYHLEHVILKVQQGIDKTNTELDVYELKSMVLTDLYQMREASLQETLKQVDSLRTEVDQYRSIAQMGQMLLPELKVLFPSINSILINYADNIGIVSGKSERVLLVYITGNGTITQREHEILSEWLKARMKTNQLKLIIEQESQLITS